MSLTPLARSIFLLAVLGCSLACIPTPALAATAPEEPQAFVSPSAVHAADAGIPTDVDWDEGDHACQLAEQLNRPCPIDSRTSSARTTFPPSPDLPPRLP